MDLYTVSPSLTIEKDQIILIQDIEHWYHTAGLHHVLRHWEIQPTRCPRIVEYILQEELSAVFILPVHQITQPDHQAPLLHADLIAQCGGRLSYISRELLFVPQHRHTTEIDLWLVGMTLYLRYGLIGPTGRHSG